MEVIKTKQAMRGYAAAHRGKIGFAPTMGYLHEGHLSLVERAKAENERTVVSIFVNPAQFNDPADLEKYPVDLERDLGMLDKAGVDAVFLPERAEVYPRGVPELKLTYPKLMRRLCGEFRPGHFEGVLLIVHNLFQWVSPRRSYFGLKDYQQYLLIREMARDMEFETEVIGCPLIRERDGLAMSSRNVRLSGQGRARALAISAALFAAEKKLSAGNKNYSEIAANLKKDLGTPEVEYAGVYDADTLEEAPDGSAPKSILIAVAAFVDGVRLIDNVLFAPNPNPLPAAANGPKAGGRE